MKALKYILFLLLILIIGVAIYIAVQPNTFEVSRTRTINAPAPVLYNNVIDYKNVKLLTAFLTKYGKIRPRRKTRVTVQHQRAIAKSIRKARALGVIPFTCDVKI